MSFKKIFLRQVLDKLRALSIAFTQMLLKKLKNNNQMFVPLHIKNFVLNNFNNYIFKYSV